MTGLTEVPFAVLWNPQLQWRCRNRFERKGTATHRARKGSTPTLKDGSRGLRFYLYGKVFGCTSTSTSMETEVLCSMPDALDARESKNKDLKFHT